MGVHRSWEGTEPCQPTPTERSDTPDCVTSCSTRRDGRRKLSPVNLSLPIKVVLSQPVSFLTFALSILFPIARVGSARAAGWAELPAKVTPRHRP